MHTSLTKRAIAFLALAASPAFAQATAYMTNNDLASAVQSIASSPHANATTIGESLGSNPIHLITLAGSIDSADAMPALLITAGIDAEHLVGTETATRIAQQILSDHADILDQMTIYIIPRANPDGAARNLKSLSMGTPGNARSIDEDRDRAADEDGPEDLNNDGYITMMRRLNPPISDPATHLADPDDTRLSITPDPKESQHPTFTLYTEGIDNDNDGSINVDGFAGVDLNKNFMHRWPEYDTHSGAYQLSEPESAALAEFVLNHDNIVMAITLGQHDNLINLPDAKGKDITGRAPLGIDAKDLDLYKFVSERFKETTDQKTAPKADDAGSFHSWLYAQRGLPSFASVVWTRPEPAGEDKSKADEAPKPKPDAEHNGLHPSPIGDISQETLDELSAAYEAMTGEKVDASMQASVTPEMIERFAAQAGIEVRRYTAPPEAEDTPKPDDNPKKKTKSEDAKWLEYFDSAGITGFVDWQPYEHPTLGSVEIGGFLPLARTNPPASDLDDLATKQTAFVLDLVESRPEITITGPEIKELANGLYDIRLAITNTGKLPTTTPFAESTRSVRPVIVRLSATVDQILTGKRIDRFWTLPANNGRADYHWIIRTDNIASETIEIIDPRFGNHTLKLGN
ncbi:MAG: hypothetical protein KC996_01320 [Phycisphaerales bacterium]|nr:hypothetical protein [Phycisphaerales bacterium]